MTDETERKAETLAVQALGWEDRETGAVVPPVHLSTTFARDAETYETPDGRTYIRAEGWSQEHAEAVIQALEGGGAAMVFGSGIAACTAPLHGLKQGDRMAMSRTIYHGILRFAEVFLADWGIGVDYFDSGDLDGLTRAVRPGETRLVWVETPANPTWAVTDIAAAAEIARKAGAMLAVDSTAATPVLTRPLELGADLVCHSATKFLNGHSDVIAGAGVTKEDGEFWQRMQMHRRVAGPLLGSFEAYLLAAACARCSCGCAGNRRTPSPWPVSWKRTRASNLSIIPDSRAIPGMKWQAVKCKAASGACCRSWCRVGATKPSEP